MSAPVDLLLVGAQVADGTGAPLRRADVAVAGGRITAVGNLAGLEAAKRLDVGGLVVTPGFVDMHSHSDLSLHEHPGAESRIGQGITTEVVGNCGASPLFLTGEQAQSMDGDGSRPVFPRLSDFFAFLEANPVATNVLSLLGQGSIRAAVMDYQSREPSAEELERMRVLVASGMEDGAFGLSTGLIYPPGAYASTEEVIALAAVAGRYGGLYFTHMRDEADGLFDALREAIRIGREGRLGLQVSHLKAAGGRQWGRMGEAIGLIEEARAQGQDAAADFYPYHSGATHMSGLLPTGLMEGGTPGMMARLADPAYRRFIADAIAQGIPGWWNPIGAGGGWHIVTVVGVDSDQNRWVSGLTVSEIAARRGVDDLTAALDLLEAERGAVGIVIRMMREDDIALVARTPWVTMGTDGAAQTPPPDARPEPGHPRSYGTTACLIGTHVRDRGDLTLEAAVHRMTGLAAARLGLRGRGTIAPGQAADLVVLDPEAVEETATYADVHHPPRGFHHVLVNGEFALKDQTFTGRRPGRVIRRSTTTA